VGSAAVAYVEADVFEWEPSRTFDAIFFSFWLSHVPPERFGEFWSRLKGWLKPEGRVFFIDSRFEGSSTAKDQGLRTPRDTVVSRRLSDGRTFTIVKVFYEPSELKRQLEGRGWRAEVDVSGDFFLYGSAVPVQTSPAK